MQNISVRTFFVANLIFPALAIPSLACIGVGAAIVDLAGKAQGGHGLPLHWSHLVAAPTTYLLLVVTGYCAAGLAPRAPVLFAALSSSILFVFCLFGLFVSEARQDIPADIVQAISYPPAAALGGLLRVIQHRIGMVIPWRRVGRDAAATILGLFVVALVFAACGALHWVSLEMPILAVSLGCFAAWLATPAADRLTVMSVFFGLLIVAAAGAAIEAVLTHAMRPIYWFNLLWIAAAWFLAGRQLRKAAA